mmetsp:Transcript_14601/g.34630  ORF Transcript_14601/g.34630 Transcript_14601/m.34630 type:complete len:142 (-) Transcript_14601:72-497(-)
MGRKASTQEEKTARPVQSTHITATNRGHELGGNSTLMSSSALHLLQMSTPCACHNSMLRFIIFIVMSSSGCQTALWRQVRRVQPLPWERWRVDLLLNLAFCQTDFVIVLSCPQFLHPDGVAEVGLSCHMQSIHWPKDAKRR